METFVLLPFFLLSRVPQDTYVWRYGPEYTFDVKINVTAFEAHYFLELFQYQISSSLMCRPWDFDTLRCQFDVFNLIAEAEEPDVFMDEDIWLQMPFDIKFNRQGIEGLVVPREMESRYIDVIRTIVSQMNFGVELLHKPDGAFKVMEKTYFGDCDGLVNISREIRGNEVPRKEAYEIVTMAGLKKKRGEVLVITKTRNLTNCADKRDYFFGSERNPKLDAPMLTSHSRIAISDVGFDSYTKNMINIKANDVQNFLYHEKFSMSLVSVLPAKEALEPFSDDRVTVSPYAFSEKY